MPVINKIVYFRTTLSEHPLTRMQTRILSQRDSTGVTGVFIDDILAMWFDDLFARDCDCYISIVDENMTDAILEIAHIHSDKTGQTVIVDSGKNWR